MAYQSLIMERKGAIATITLNRPDVGNAFNKELMNELDAAFKEISQDENIWAVLLTGAGKHFSSGIDLSLFSSLGDAAAAVEDSEGETYAEGTLAATVIRIRSMSKPVIAAINGAAIGAGLGLALACDIRIASDKSRFASIFVKRAVAPDSGCSFTLPRVIGLPRACEFMFTGDIIDAEEADRIGLVNRVVPHDDLMKTAMELVEKIAKNPPLAVGIAKEAMNRALTETDIKEQLKYEVSLQSKLLKTEDFMEAAKAFLEKREPIFKGK
ncbi:MAG TPA: enoyl-CoA hydratase/isomerase family protein [Dehalococcoidia bacterium]|nr:enoyl-CoA hydratase/isomerase family protein [Dehalococcoidia bacterium]